MRATLMDEATLRELRKRYPPNPERLCGVTDAYGGPFVGHRPGYLFAVPSPELTAVRQRGLDAYAATSRRLADLSAKATALEGQEEALGQALLDSRRQHRQPQARRQPGGAARSRGRHAGRQAGRRLSRRSERWNAPSSTAARRPRR